MAEIKRILCPTDWSEPSRVALMAAVNMARFEGAELEILHVLPPLGLVRGIAAVVPLGQVIQNEAIQKLAGLIAECVPGDVTVNPVIRTGDEADEIYLAALTADVVIMSTHGRSGWARWAFGSVADTVLGKSTCPIFVVGPGSVQETRKSSAGYRLGSSFDFPYRKVLWPTDWSKLSERALDKAIVIATQHNAQLLLIHVITTPETVVGGGWDQEYAEAYERFRELLTRKPQLEAAHRFVCHGDAAAEICRFSIDEGADLIVMSTHGRTGWQRLKLGSVAQKVLRQLPCPVFLVPDAASAVTQGRLELAVSQ